MPAPPAENPFFADLGQVEHGRGDAELRMGGIAMHRLGPRRQRGGPLGRRQAKRLGMRAAAEPEDDAGAGVNQNGSAKHDRAAVLG